MFTILAYMKNIYLETHNEFLANVNPLVGTTHNGSPRKRNCGRPLIITLERGPGFYFCFLLRAKVFILLTSLFQYYHQVWDKKVFLQVALNGLASSKPGFFSTTLCHLKCAWVIKVSLPIM